MSRRILIIGAHPALYRSKFHQQILRVIGGLEGITYHDLYEEYPKFIINHEKEKKLLVSYDVIIFQHSLYWYSAPALLKEWMDVVLIYDDLNDGAQSLLRGKFWMSAISIGSPLEDFSRHGVHGYSLTEFMRPFEQTAKLCQMQWLPPFVGSGLKTATEIEMSQICEAYRRVLIGLRDELLHPEDLSGLTYINQDLAQLNI